MIRGFKKREKNQERLKKLSDKKVYTPKRINQKGANLIFGSLLIGFVVFVGFAAVLSIKNISKVKEFENELDEENFECKMKNEALCQRVKFFQENEVPEELRKEKEKIEKLQEEKRTEEEKTEARFRKYMDQYATGLETEKE